MFLTYNTYTYIHIVLCAYTAYKFITLFANVMYAYNNEELAEEDNKSEESSSVSLSDSHNSHNSSDSLDSPLDSDGATEEPVSNPPEPEPELDQFTAEESREIWRKFVDILNNNLENIVNLSTVQKNHMLITNLINAFNILYEQHQPSQPQHQPSQPQSQPSQPPNQSDIDTLYKLWHKLTLIKK
jgi:hypothetical protein